MMLITTCLAFPYMRSRGWSLVVAVPVFGFFGLVDRGRERRAEGRSEDRSGEIRGHGSLIYRVQCRTFRSVLRFVEQDRSAANQCAATGGRPYPDYEKSER